MAKKWLIGIGIFLLFLLLTPRYIDFTITDEEARERLQESDVPVQFGDLTHNTYNIHYAYTDTQKDYLIIFIHGSPGSWSAFINFFKADSILINSDMISIDRPGFGLSQPASAETSLETQAKLMHLVSKKFEHPKKILVGHSLGGPVIARMAMDYPDTYHSLILVAPSIDPDLEERQWYQMFLQSKIGRWVAPSALSVSNDEIVPLKKELELMLPYWNEIDIPTIVIQGTEDSLVPKENADFAQRMIADSILTINLLEGVDHFIPWTDPKEIIEAIRQLTVPQ